MKRLLFIFAFLLPSISVGDIVRTTQPPEGTGPNLNHPLVKYHGYLAQGGTSQFRNVMTGEAAALDTGSALTVEMTNGYRATRFNETIITWSRDNDRFELPDSFSGFILMADHVDNGQAQALVGTSFGTVGWMFEAEIFSNNQNIGWTNFGAGGDDFVSTLGTSFAPLAYFGFTVEAGDPSDTTLYLIDVANGHTQERTGTALNRGVAPSATATMQVGGRSGDGAEFRLDANVIAVAVMPGEWSTSDHYSVAMNPWQLFDPLTNQPLQAALASGAISGGGAALLLRRRRSN